MRAGRRAFAAGCGLLVVGTLLSLGLAGGFSSGKADSARSGCGDVGCHGIPGQGSPLVRALLDGLPEEYTPGGRYNLTVSVADAPPILPAAQNAGGFALEASAGSMAAVDDAAQAADASATHTEAGNDQREWQVEWLAPPQPAGEVTFYLSANAVDGNGAADPGDQWASAMFMLPAGQAPPPPPPPGNATQEPTPPARTPGPAGAEVGLAVLAAVAVLAAQRRRG